jgi:uncharacterized delta-60 repeat protein
VRSFVALCSVFTMVAAAGCGNVESSDPVPDAATPGDVDAASPGDVDAAVDSDAPIEVSPDASVEIPDAFVADAAPGMVGIVAPVGTVFLRRSGSERLPVQVLRGPGVTGAVTVTATNLPQGVTASPIVVAESEDRGTVTLRAASDASLQQTSIVLSAAADGAASGTVGAHVEIIGLAGTPDTTFGQGGALPVSSYGVLLDVVAAGDKILAVFRRSNTRTIVFVRFQHDGTIDVSYGVNGQVSVDIGVPGLTRLDSAMVHAQPDGKVIVVGSGPNGTDNDTVITRFTAAGARDAGFTPRRLDRDGESVHPSAVAVGPTGEIVVAASKFVSGGRDQFFARLDSAGMPDSGFGSAGVLVRSELAYDTVTAIHVQIDGRILAVVGSSANQSNLTVDRIIRLRTNGELDPSFAGDGRIGFSELRNPELGVVVHGLAPGVGDGFFVHGTARYASLVSGDDAVWAFELDGDPETGFGVAGAWIAPESANHEGVTDLAFLEDGSMITVGISTPSPDDPNYGQYNTELGHVSRAGVVVPSFGTSGFAIDTRFMATTVTAAPRHRVLTFGAPLAGEVQIWRYWH